MTSIPDITARVCQRRSSDLTAKRASIVCFQMNLFNEVGTLLLIIPVKVMTISNNLAMGGIQAVKQSNLVTV